MNKRTGRTIFKRIIPVAVGLVMMLAIMSAGSTTAFAATAFAGGAGTAGDPWQIETAEQLDNVRDYTGDHFILMNDIDLTEYLSEGGAGYNGGAGWQPIGIDEALFMGTFDGNGHTISGLYINSSDISFVGLFGITHSSACIRNLGLTDINVYISGNSCSGTAGMVGLNNGTIDACYAEGSVTGNDCVGLLVGCNNSYITRSWAKGTVNGITGVGGLVGQNLGIIRNSYAMCSVTGENVVGGLVGYNDLYDISNCYAAGAVTCGEDAGGLLGITYHEIDTGSYYNSSTSGLSDTGKGEPRTSAQMVQQATFEGWDFDTVWTISEGSSYPYLRWGAPDPLPAPPTLIGITVTPETLALRNGGASGALSADPDPAGALMSVNWTSSNEDVATVDENGVVTPVGLGTATITATSGDYYDTADVAVNDFAGSGTAEDPWQITTAEELDMIRDHLGDCFILMNDIDLTAYLSEGGAGYNGGAGWLPIGTDEEPFTGAFNGDGHAIIGLYVNSAEPYPHNIGLFGVTYKADFENLGLLNVDVSACYYVGGLAGNVTGGTIDSCCVTGVVKSLNYGNDAGGLVGIMEGGVISNSFAACSFFDGFQNIGGLVGINNNGTITGSFADCAVSGSTSIGGLVGYNSGGSIDNSFAAGTIVKTSYYGSIGGLAGFNSGTMNNSYSACSISTPPETDNSGTGGLVGTNEGTASGSYFNKQAAGRDNGAGYGSSDGMTALDPVEMVQQAAFAGWDFDTVWAISERSSYPYLRWGEPDPLPAPPAGIFSAEPVSMAEAAVNDGSLDPDTLVITIYCGTLASDISKADVTSHNLPAGLDYTVARTNDTTLTITFTGKADSHADADDLSNLNFTIAQAKVNGVEADLTTGDIGIDFLDPYTVTFDAGTGAAVDPASKQVGCGETYGALPAPERTGYGFEGWYTEPDGAGQLITESTPADLISDITLYAMWTANTYTVVYNSNGGTGTTESSIHTYDTSKTLTLNGFTRKAYEFAGWADSASGPAAYSNEQSVVNLSAEDGATVTLYAVWVPGIKITGTATSYNSVKLTWRAFAEAKGYEVHRAASADGPFKNIKTITKASVLTYTNTSLATGKAYYYKVRAYWYESGKKVYSEYSGVEAATPKLKEMSGVRAATYYPTAIKISWNSVPGRTKYYVYRSDTPDGEYKYIGSTARTYYKNKGLTVDKAYYYKVRAYRKVGGVKVFNEMSDPVSDTARVFQVKNAKARMYSVTKNKISWSSVTGRSGYEILRSETEDGVYSPVGTTGYTYYYDKNLIPNKTYYYRIRAYRTVSSVRHYGPESGIVSAMPVFKDVTNVKAYMYSVTGNRISWSGVSGRTGYEVWWCDTEDGTYRELTAAGKAYTYTYIYHKNLEAEGKPYYYKVKAYVTVKGVRQYSAETEAVTAYNRVNGIKGAMYAVTSNKISWSSVAGRSGYEVWWSESEDGEYKQLTVPGKAWTYTYIYHKGIDPLKIYYYKVRAYQKISGATVYSGYSDTVEVVNKINNAKAYAYSYTSSKISWSGVSGRDYYEIYRYDPAADEYVYLNRTRYTYYYDKGLTTDTTYYYKVRAYDTVGGVRFDSGFSGIVSATPALKAATGFKASRYNSSKIKLKWSSVSGATGYEIQRCTTGTDFATIKKTTGKSTYYYNGGLSKGTKYYYRIRAYRTVGENTYYGGWSAVRSAKP